MKRNSKKELELKAYATLMLTKFNLNDNWKFLVLDKYERRNVGGNAGLSTCGYCNLSLEIIFFSSEFVTGFKMHTLKDIFLHELAHAIAGKENFGHTKKFREIAKSLGCQSIKASHNPYIFDMYNTYNVTPKQEQKCMMKYYKTNKK